MLYQGGQVFGALAQRGQFDWKHNHAVVEIAAEASTLNQLLKVAMGGHDDAHIDGRRLIGADSLHFAFFKDAQQLGLHRWRHIADLVEEERAAMSLLELAGVALCGAGERAFLVAEELALNQLGRNGGAVEGNKWGMGAWAFFVQRARHQLFAGAGFAIDADARFACRHALDLRHHAPHGFAGEDQSVLANAGAEILILGFEAGELERVFYGDEKLFSRERLLKKVESAETRSADSHFDVRLAAHHHNRCGHAGSLQVFKQRETVAARHDHIAEDEIEGLRASQLERAHGVVANHGLVAGETKGAGKRCQRVGFIVDDEDVCFCSHDGVPAALGSVMTKVAPPPVRLSTEIEPLWSATTDCTMASPRPVPCSLVV